MNFAGITINVFDTQVKQLKPNTVPSSKPARYHPWDG